jgi:hypothetical protein
MDAIVIESPEKQAERDALKTLVEIQTYVYTNYNRFSLPMIASILGRVKAASKLQDDILRLVKLGHVETVGNGVYELTMSGKLYDPNESDDGFHIEFAERDPEAPPPEEP